jgi:hypothetical protein
VVMNPSCKSQRKILRDETITGEDIPENGSEETILITVSNYRRGAYGREWREVCIRHVSDGGLALAHEVQDVYTKDSGVKDIRHLQVNHIPHTRRQRTTLTSYKTISRFQIRKGYPGRDIKELQERMRFYH